MRDIHRHMARLGLLIAVLAVLCLGLAACTDYSSPGGGAPSNSTPSSGGYGY